MFALVSPFYFLLLITLFWAHPNAAFDAVTTRYWDCCKPSCAWKDKADVTRPVQTCTRNGLPITSTNFADVISGCNGGGSFSCDSQSPFIVSDKLSYGFAAAKLKDQTEKDWCCACYKLTFTSGPVKGKNMIVQVTNTGGDLGNNHFDLQIPGGGQGLFRGCEMQYTKYIGGALYGGISNVSECDKLPANQKRGCLWRFKWFKNADNPKVKAERVKCPGALVSISKCSRKD